MTTLLDVAKHALQAMEDAMYRADTHEFYDAKEALRTAIEHAEFDAVHDALEKESGIHITQQAEQQEPLMDEADVLMLAEAHGIDAATVGLYSFYVDCMSTSPPQRKPLSDEDLEKIFPAIATYHESNKTLYRSIARAVERAHGIGGGQ